MNLLDLLLFIALHWFAEKEVLRIFGLADWSVHPIQSFVSVSVSTSSRNERLFGSLETAQLFQVGFFC
jgi:hypothetical protein